MRLPPLPEPSPPVTEEWLRERHIGDDLPRLPGPIEIVGYDPTWPNGPLLAGKFLVLRT